MNINAGRLTQHLKIAGAEYTLIIAPQYAPSAVKYDINNSKICTIRTAVFAEYIQNTFMNDEYSYIELNNIIKKSYGNDISDDIEKLSFTNKY